jgi:hypothetical protein
MPWFRKRPVVVEARELTTNNWDDLKTWINNLGGDAFLGSGDISIGIRTLEGNMRADVGDWIIRGVNGEFYPCKPDIFEKTYEPIVGGAR